MYMKRRLNISLIITCTLQMSMMRRNKTPNLGRVRPKSYAKSDARKPKSTKKQPPELESSETVSLPATDSHSRIQFNTDSEKHEECPSNPQLPIRKEFYEIVTELMENSVVTEICEGDDFSFENLIPDNKIHVIEDNNEDPLMGQDEENQASDSGEIFPKDTTIYPGETYRTQKGGSVHTFPYDASMPKHEVRTTENCLRDAALATENRKTVNGIKGPSFLMTLKSYDFVKSTSKDYMHGVLLGIGKLLINL
uniref:Uncharacterized protein n=1 Tax=Magallana gigas TaxID=29159 RepID=A0A8W8NV81_MAGGI